MYGACGRAVAAWAILSWCEVLSGVPSESLNGECAMGGRLINAKKKSRRRAHAAKRKATEQAVASKKSGTVERSRNAGASLRPPAGR